MGGGEMTDNGRVSVAIFGAGRVGTAAAAEMPAAPLISRGADCRCDVACICWPAQAIADFAASCPAAATARKVAFCNGVWAVAAGADEQGCCYVRAVNRGDVAAPGRKAWRVENLQTARLLRAAGLKVICSRTAADHERFVWEKTLYIVPLALACAETCLEAGQATGTAAYIGWYVRVRGAAAAAIGPDEVARCEPRVKFLCGRSPKGWRPSPSLDELAYFRRMLAPFMQ